MAITSDARLHVAERTGIGLRLPHIAEVVATRPPVGWLETNPENFLANPHGLELLTDLACHYPVSVQTVGISIGSADGIARYPQTPSLWVDVREKRCQRAFPSALSDSVRVK